MTGGVFLFLNELVEHAHKRRDGPMHRARSRIDVALVASPEQGITTGGRGQDSSKTPDAHCLQNK